MFSTAVWMILKMLIKEIILPKQQSY